MKNLFHIFILCAFGLLAACSSSKDNTFSPEVTEAFAHPQSAVLYSVEPGYNASGLAPQQSFHGHRIVGQTAMTGAQAKDAFDALAAAITEHNSAIFPTTYACFNPRHDIRVENSGEVYDLLVCYECAQVEVYENNAQVRHLYLDMPEKSPYPKALNDILGAASIRGPVH